ncbi:hypothetical protein [Phenylobacterium sp.]|uniref:hypothetical protein n=1 Tax=Phenylobacterium sp. TaxID=1871053 RepID=UPI0025EFD99A|nr:hypothetical protein [Phenylobacterium sp.]
MAHHEPDRPVTGACEIVDFDDALLAACAPAVRADLLLEAGLLAGAFAPGGGKADLQRMAVLLSTGARDGEIGRAHARRLAAALKSLAKAT